MNGAFVLVRAFIAVLPVVAPIDFVKLILPVDKVEVVLARFVDLDRPVLATILLLARVWHRILPSRVANFLVCFARVLRFLFEQLFVLLLVLRLFLLRGLH